MLEVKLALIDRRVRFQPDLLPPPPPSSSSMLDASSGGGGNNSNNKAGAGASSLRDLVQGVIGASRAVWCQGHGCVCIAGPSQLTVLHALVDARHDNCQAASSTPPRS